MRRGDSLGLPTLLVAFVVGCAPARTPEAFANAVAPRARPPLAPRALQTREELRSWSREGRIALGHQDAVSYGVGWKGDPARSDVGDVCGRGPKVLGFDLGHLELGNPENLDGVPFSRMRERIRENYELGAVVTVSWHLRNLGSGGDAWDTSRGAAGLLRAGEGRARLEDALARARRFLTSLRTDDGTRIPVLFRPLHEHNGSWFWWGRGQTSESDYRTLFRLVVDALDRDESGAPLPETSLLVAYSPSGGASTNRDEYLWGYPGDEVVDVLGLDHYYEDDVESLLGPLRIVVREAEARGKVAALTEFGPKREHYDERPRWLLDDFWRPLSEDPIARRISFALAWRNDRPAHAFLPYPGHPSSATLRELCSREDIVLGEPSPPASSRP